MGYDRLQKVYLTQEPGGSTDYIDLNASAATVLTLVPDAKEKMWVFGAGLRFTEVVAASGFNTTLPVVTMSYDSANGGSPTAKATWTGSTAAVALGAEDYFTDFEPFLVDGSLGDALEFSISTQGAGQTVTGEATPFILVSYEFGLDGA